MCGPLPVRKRFIVTSLSPEGCTILKETVTGLPAATGADGWKSTVCVVSAFWIVGVCVSPPPPQPASATTAARSGSGESEGAAQGHGASFGNRYELCGTT